MKEKLFKLKQLGVSVSIIDNTTPARGVNWDEFLIDPNLSKEQVEKLIDEKIRFIENKPWLSFVKNQSTSMKFKDLCTRCEHYHFVINGYKTIVETCAKGHFKNLMGRISCITICNDFQFKQ